MEEIAASMAAAGLPAGFHEAAADIYDRASHADEPRPRAGRGDRAAVHPGHVVSLMRAPADSWTDLG